jgi:hypothetical protein
MTGMEFVQGAEHGEWGLDGKPFRNAELHRVVDGRIVETQVHFGWDLPHRAPQGGFIEGETAHA